MKLDNSKNNKNNINKRSKTSFIKKAFTLIELVVVIAVIAILAGVGVATYFAVNNSANRSATEQNLKQIQDLYTIYNIENEDSSFSSNDDKAYDFISSYLPEQGINSFDTDFINYIVLHKKDNSDDTKIVYVTTKPSYGYFYEDGNSLSEIKVFDKEEELKNSIINDAEFEEYDTSILEEMSVEQASTLYSSDLNNDGSVSNQEIGKKVIKVTFNYDGKDYLYYLNNGESIYECDIRYLNGSDSIFVSKEILNNTVTPFDPYGIDEDGGKILFKQKINFTGDELANFVPSGENFVSYEKRDKLYPDIEGSNFNIDTNVYVLKDIVLTNLKVDQPSVDLLNYESCYIKEGGASSTAVYGDFAAVINDIKLKDPSKTNVYNIYIGQNCIIDEDVTLEDNVKIKIPYNVKSMTTKNTNLASNKTETLTQTKKASYTPGHLTITNGSTLTVTHKGNTPLNAYAHSSDGALCVYGEYYPGRAGTPFVYTNVGRLTIDTGSKIILEDDVWFRATGLVDGKGEIVGRTNSKILQQVTAFDWLSTNYYVVSDQANNKWLWEDRNTDIFPIQKFVFNNIFCDVTLYKDSSYIAWIPLKWESDYGDWSTRDIYFSLIGDINSNIDSGEKDQAIKFQSLFGTKDDGTITISREDSALNSDASRKNDSFNEINYLRHKKMIIDFNCDVVLGDLGFFSDSIKDLSFLIGIDIDMGGFYFPLYNVDYNFNKTANLTNSSFDLKMKVLPGSSIFINDLSNFNCGAIVAYGKDDFNHYKNNKPNVISIPENFVSINPNIDGLEDGKVVINMISGNINNDLTCLAGNIKLNDKNVEDVLVSKFEGSSVNMYEINNFAKIEKILASLGKVNSHWCNLDEFTVSFNLI